MYVKYAKLGEEAGIPYCTYCMGTIYREGLWTYEKNMEMAIACWKDVISLDIEKVKLEEKDFTNSLSAVKAIFSSYINLGVTYFHGFGVKQDINKGIEYWEIAAKHGSKKAAMALIEIYEDGENVPKDHSKAEYWYEVSKKNNNGL